MKKELKGNMTANQDKMNEVLTRNMSDNQEEVKEVNEINEEKCRVCKNCTTTEENISKI